MNEDRYYVGRYAKGTWVVYDREVRFRQLPGGYGSRKEAQERADRLNAKVREEAALTKADQERERQASEEAF